MPTHWTCLKVSQNRVQLCLWQIWWEAIDSDPPLRPIRPSVLHDILGALKQRTWCAGTSQINEPDRVRWNQRQPRRTHLCWLLRLGRTHDRIIQDCRNTNRVSTRATFEQAAPTNSARAPLTVSGVATSGVPGVRCTATGGKAPAC